MATKEKKPKEMTLEERRAASPGWAEPSVVMVAPGPINVSGGGKLQKGDTLTVFPHEVESLLKRGWTEQKAAGKTKLVQAPADTLVE